MWRHLFASKRSRGTAAIEFGLALPLLLALIVAAVELGFAMYDGMQVYDAAEAGAIYAAKNGWDAAGIVSAVTEATGTTGISATPVPEQFCGCPSGSNIATTDCGPTYVNGDTPGTYVRVSASLAHTTILPYPGFSLPTTFTATSVVRLN